MSNIYGYCLTFTPTQSLKCQEKNIKSAYKDSIIYCEKYSNHRNCRPVWNKLYSDVMPGDTVIFNDVSRIGLTKDEGFYFYSSLYKKGVTLVFLQEPYLNTSMYSVGNIDSTAVNIVIDDMMKKQFDLAFSTNKNALELLKCQTKKGIATARTNGKQIGGKSGSTYTIKNKEPIKEIIRSNSKSFDGDFNDVEVMNMINSTKYVDDNSIEHSYHISNNTYYKYKKELIDVCFA